jgi:predicted esterase
VPLKRAEQSKELMAKLGAEVTLKIYKGMGHTINQDEINWATQAHF